MQVGSNSIFRGEDPGSSWWAQSRDTGEPCCLNRTSTASIRRSPTNNRDTRLGLAATPFRHQALASGCIRRWSDLPRARLHLNSHWVAELHRRPILRPALYKLDRALRQHRNHPQASVTRQLSPRTSRLRRGQRSTQQFGTSPADHVGLGESPQRFLDGEQPAFEAIQHHFIQMRGVYLRRQVDDGSQRCRAPDALDRGDIGFWNVVAMNDDLLLARSTSAR